MRFFYLPIAFDRHAAAGSSMHNRPMCSQGTEGTILEKVRADGKKKFEKKFSDLVEQMEEGAVNTLQELADAGSKVCLITTKPA